MIKKADDFYFEYQAAVSLRMKTMQFPGGTHLLILGWNRLVLQMINWHLICISDMVYCSPAI